MDKQKFIERQMRLIEAVCGMHRQIWDLDESLKKMYPIAIVKDDIFYIFGRKGQNCEYEFIMEYPAAMELPAKILAAFPLDFYDDKIAAVICADEFANPDNHVFVFHEFVHCYQFENFEQALKKGLKIYGEEMQKGNFMWEITHPFPYDDEVFVALTNELIGTFGEISLENFVRYHDRLKKHLNIIDFEYMVWQQWKEGYARYVENLIRKKLGMKENLNGLSAPFNRVSFYEIGCRHIEALIKNDPKINRSIDGLFYAMTRRLKPAKDSD
ncbi:MAG: hypothetical protein LBE35_03450 [Clostridiales bacterium]|jgi:hypothetical protein|nr:hypothetical protein [Clostridiales bacterium]